jgi:hypothetical protein
MGSEIEAPRHLPSQEEQEWLLGSLRELIEHCGWQRFVSAHILLPTPKYLPGKAGDDLAAGVYVLCRRLLGWVGLGELEVELSFFTGSDDAGDDTETIAVYRGIRDGVCSFAVRTDQLADAEGLLGALSHEVAHAWRDHQGLSSQDELLTDLTTIYLGLGVDCARHALHRPGTCHDPDLLGGSDGRTACNRLSPDRGARPVAVDPGDRCHTRGPAASGADLPLVPGHGRGRGTADAIRRLCAPGRRGCLARLDPGQRPRAPGLQSSSPGAGDPAGAIEMARAVDEAEPDHPLLSERILNRLGYHLLASWKLTDEAIAVFKLNTEHYPGSVNVWDSLGEAYYLAGEDELAIAQFRKVLELDPGNQRARAILEQLGVTPGSTEP